MAKSPNLAAPFRPSRRMWNDVVRFIIPSILQRTDKGRDRDGKPFKAYDKDYAEKKGRGMTTQEGRKYAHLRGQSTDRQTVPPNFRLRGLTMSDLSKIAQSDEELVIGWRGEFGAIVAAHEKRGKYKVGGVTKDEHKTIVDMIDAHMVSEWNRKTRNVTLTVTV